MAEFSNKKRSSINSRLNSLTRDITSYDVALKLTHLQTKHLLFPYENLSQSQMQHTRIFKDPFRPMENQICEISLFTTLKPYNLAIQKASSSIIHHHSPHICGLSKPQIPKEIIIKVEISPPQFFNFVPTPRIRASNYSFPENIQHPRRSTDHEKAKRGRTNKLYPRIDS